MEPHLDPVISQRLRVQVILLSIGMGILILGAKYVAYRCSGSAALKSDAIESIVNVLAAAFALGAVVFAGKPADKEHPYGHGKIEHFSAFFEGGLISIASALILYEGVVAMIRGPQLKDLGLGLAINFAAGVANGLLGMILLRVGRAQKSKAIEADGHHVLSDFLTTLAVGAGLILVKLTGWVWLDPVLALGVGLLLAFTGIRLVRDASTALLDSEDPALLESLVVAMNRHKPDDVIAVHELRTLRSGRYTHVDVHVVVPEFYPIGRAHDVVERFGAESIRETRLEGEFHSHVDPCSRLYCISCQVQVCPVRQQPFAGRQPLTVELATAPGPDEPH